MQNRAKFHFDNIYNDYMLVGPYIVFQVGDLSCEPGYVVPVHTQEVHEISYVVSGEGTFLVDGIHYPVKRGTVFLNTVGDVHEIISSRQSPLRFMYIGFLIREGIAGESVRLLDAFYQNPRDRLRENLFDVQESFIRLLTEFIERDAFSELLMECCVHQLLCQVYRLVSPKRKGAYHVAEGERTDLSRLVYDITHYIDTHIGSLTHLSGLSDEFGYSYTYIAVLFSKQMGETLSQYHTRRKFEKAMDYLKQGVSITDTAQLLGYQSIHSFSRAFKKHSGICPSEYRPINKIEK